ncbi:MAG: hypothetical protein SCALA702_32370 [Melioribacteraceae bacterium]|nr:MAG: hypothetical protein SCALA702_32370 [Melioribacteraceae bacterium]
MLINLTNHTTDTWTETQLEEANKCFGEIINLAFPAINPQNSLEEIKELAKKYLFIILEIKKNNPGVSLSVLLSGEYTFVFNLVEMLKVKHIKVYSATSERISRDMGDNKKEIVFRFVKFRPYY